MSVEQFFTLFLEELKHHPKLREYYKFHDDLAKFPFRKAYFCQRLQYILDQVNAFLHPSSLIPRPSALAPHPSLWDCGCGYATTQIFLALNGIPSRGTTLEFYYKEIPQRRQYWSQYGDMNLVGVSYEDVFESQAAENSTDIIIVQDTLHHLEPLQDSLAIFYKTLRPGGILLAVEENGNNLVQSLKLYRQRGNRRIIQYFDEGLGRMVTMGNENIRPYRLWKKELRKAGFQPDDSRVQYVRLFPPGYFNRRSEAAVMEREQALWKKHALLREYFFFGVNFVARK